MKDSIKDDASDSDLPRPNDGFHKPDAETRRRNLITAGIILLLLGAWILFGLRRVIFG